MDNLNDRREQLCLNFAKKCTKNPKTANMFPLNNKTHKMQIRNPEKFQVQHAFHDRLKNSTIIHAKATECT